MRGLLARCAGSAGGGILLALAFAPWGLSFGLWHSNPLAQDLPMGDEWLAVRDRLMRAAVPKADETATPA